MAHHFKETIYVDSDEIVEIDSIDEQDDEAVGDAAVGEALAGERRLLERLREALLASEPALDRSMVTGDSLDEIEASFAAAKGTLANVRQAVRREQAAAVPAGAIGRATVEPKSAFAKIRDGLRG